MIISIIPSDLIFTVDEQALEFLEPCREFLEPRASPETVLAECEIGQAQLWGVFDDDVDVANLKLRTVFVTKVTPYPLLRALFVINFSGDGEGTGHSCNEVLENFARDNDCQVIEFMAPDHVVRWAKRYGYTKQGLSLAERWVDGRR